MFHGKNELPQACCGAFRQLGMLLPTVQRVHGAEHPELMEVGRLSGELRRKLEEGAPAAETAALVRQLRALTGRYTAPDDACPAFRKTYVALAEVDQALTAD